MENIHLTIVVIKKDYGILNKSSGFIKTFTHSGFPFDDELVSPDFAAVLEPYKDRIAQISSLLKLLIDSE
jgi:hypothetical protein